MATKTTITRIGNLDVQFAAGSSWDPVKAQRMVQSLQDVISNVNGQATEIAALQSSGGSTTVPAHVLATTSGLASDHTVSGLTAGQVLIATAADNAAFAFLKFGQIFQTDPGTFEAPQEGDVITFVDGYWSAAVQNPFAISDPGSNALLAWNGAGYGWVIPDDGLELTSGMLTVDQTSINHANLEGLYYVEGSGGTVIANDHPQYGLVSGTNSWAAPQTFTLGLVAQAESYFYADTYQSAATPSWWLENTPDTTDEGIWRIHAESGQLIFSTVSDDGSDGENWLSVTRVAEIADQVNLSSNSFTWNGDQVLTQSTLASGAYVYFTTNVAGQLIVNAAVPGAGGGSGTVTSVGAGTGLAATPSPITGAGSIALSSASIATLLLASTALQPGEVQIEEAAGWNSTAALILSQTVPQDIVIPFACTLRQVIILTQGPGGATTAGSCTVDMAHATFAGFPSALTDMTGGVPPAIASSAAPYSNTTFSGWTVTTFAQNDVIRLTLAANSAFASVKVILRMY
jgi:hypothetical protein